jgi:hypothetical protein
MKKRHDLFAAAGSLNGINPKSKFLAARLFPILIGATLAAQVLLPQTAQALTWYFQNTTNYPAEQIWLMWAQSPSATNSENTFTATYGDGTQIKLATFPNTDKLNQLSVPVQLSTLDIHTKGMSLSYVNSATLYIAFANANPFASTDAPSPNTAQYPYMQVEITSKGAQADVADLTAINYFSFPLSLTSYKAGGATPANLLQTSGFGSNSAETILKALKGTYTGKGPEISNKDGELIRVLGPSSSYTLGENQLTGGFSTFRNYLAEIYTQQTASVNPSPLKLSYTGDNGYTADAVVTKDSNGNYGVTIQNVVANTNSNAPSPQNHAVNGNITLSPDTVAADGVTPVNSPTSVTIYSGVPHEGAGTITGELAQGGQYNYLTDTLLASLSASLVTGAAGSSTPFPGNTSPTPLNQYRYQASNSWFTQNSPTDATSPGFFFEGLQPKNFFYDTYFAVISKMGNYSLYGSPYADRFSKWAVAINATAYGLPSQPYNAWTPVDSMVINIGPTSQPVLAVPLPAVKAQNYSVKFRPKGKVLKDGYTTIQLGKAPTTNKAGVNSSFIITNTGKKPLTGLKITKDGAAAADFTITGLNKKPLPPGKSITVNVTFRPKTEGNKQAFLHITNNESLDNSFDLTLIGTGMRAKKPR